ncbi:STAS domain protein [Gimesia maris]|nr:STAS domain protein [Gimesia maris]
MTYKKSVQSLPISLGSLEWEDLTTVFDRLSSETRIVDKGNYVIFSLKNVKHVGASFIGLILQVHQEALQRGVFVLFSEPQPLVSEILFLCGLSMLLTV